MIVVLSPSKKLDYSKQSLTKRHSQPDFLDDSQQLINELRKLSKGRIGKLMGISEQLSELNLQRCRIWSPPFDTKNAKQAILAFQGDVYQGFQWDHWKAGEFTFAQKHIRILSGLYGVLRPLDLMQPYRLEMGTKLKTKRGKDLYEFWGDTLTSKMNADISASRSRALVNLASNEYFHAIETAAIRVPIVTPVFKDEKNGKYKVISYFAKRARGMMANFIVENRIKKPEQLKEFDVAGYRFDAKSSSEQQLIFLRDEA